MFDSFRKRCATVVFIPGKINPCWIAVTYMRGGKVTRNMVTKAFIVISSLLLCLECSGDRDKANGKSNNTHPETKSENDEESIEKDQKSTTSPTSESTIRVEISSSQEDENEAGKTTNQKDYCNTTSSKIDLTLAIALIFLAFCVGAVVMAVVLCCTQEKWTSRFSSRHHLQASKLSTEKSDTVLVTLDVHVQTNSPVDVLPDYKKSLSAKNIPINPGDAHLETRVPSEPNVYEIMFEHGNRRSSLEHPYGSLFAESDHVNSITDVEIEHNETLKNETEHDYFVLPLNEDCGIISTEGNEMKMDDENHDYFVLAPHVGDGGNLKEGNKMGNGENNNDNFVLASHAREGEMPLKIIN